MNQGRENQTGLSWAVSRTREVLRREGAGGVMLRALAALGYRLGIWFAHWHERPLTAPIEAVQSDLPLEIRLLGAADADDYVGHRPRATPESFLRRLNAGYPCYGARSGDRLVASLWSGSGRIWLDFLGAEIELGPGEAMFFDSHTNEDCRGRHVMPWLWVEAMRHLQTEGVRISIGIFALENRSIRASFHRSGYRPNGTMVFLRIGALRWHYLWGRRRS